MAEGRHPTTNYWAANGDLIVVEHTRFRRVGWQINGGPNDKKFVENAEEIDRSVPIGGYSPVYIEIGD